MNEGMNEFSQTPLKVQSLLLLEQGIASVCSIGEQVLQSYCFFFQVLSQHSVFRNSGPLVARKSFELISPSLPLSPHVPSAFSGLPHGKLVNPSVVVHPRDVAAPFPFNSLCEVGSVSHAGASSSVFASHSIS